MSTTARFITADELLNLPGDQRRELVKGELHNMAPAGFDHGRIIMKLARLLSNYVVDHNLGVVLGAETGFKLAKNPDTVRAADVSFVAASRIPKDAQVFGFWDGAPDLAVEVVSPTDTVEEVDAKVDDYLTAGARLIWIINPKRRTVTVYRPNTNPEILRDIQSLDGADIVPGFRCAVLDVLT